MMDLILSPRAFMCLFGDDKAIDRVLCVRGTQTTQTNALKTAFLYLLTYPSSVRIFGEVGVFFDLPLLTTYPCDSTIPFVSQLTVFLAGKRD